MSKTDFRRDIALIFFSATGVTRAVAGVIHDRLTASGRRTDLIDITSFVSRQKPLPLNDYSGFIFGFPVYSDFAPTVVNEWLPILVGKQRPCALFFTYGARTTGYAHFHTAELLDRAGFRVLVSAEFLGRHTFNLGGWSILPDRPDETDFNVARRYADLIAAKFSETAPAELGLQKPFRYDQTLAAWKNEAPKTGRSWTNPVRVSATCGLCRRCETECPAAAFDAAKGESDPVRCLSCLRCVADCPEKALAVDRRLGQNYAGFLANWRLTEEKMRCKQSRIIEEFTQAAF